MKLTCSASIKDNFNSINLPFMETNLKPISGMNESK